LRRELGFVKKAGIFRYEQAQVFYSPLQEKRYIDKLTEIYKEKGFARTEVTAEAENLTEDTVALRFDIREGKKFVLVKTEFEGNEDFTPKEILKGARIRTKKPWWHILPKQVKQEDLDADVQRLTRFYEDSGHYRVKVEQEEPEVIRKDRGVKVVFRIEEGETYNFGEVSAAGNRIFSTTEITETRHTAPGVLFNRTELEKDTFEIGDLYRSQGYIYTVVQPTLKPRDEDLEIDVTWDIAESSRFRLGEIHPEGVVELEDKSVESVPLKTKDFVILREFDLKRGDVLDWSRIRRSERDLLNLGYFKKMEDAYPARLKFGAQPELVEGSTDTLDIRLRLEEEPTGLVTFGGGYSTASGASVFVGVQERNLFGRGWRANVGATVGTRRQSYQLSFTEPYLFGSDYSLTLDLYRRVQDAYGGREFDDTRTGGSLRLSKEILEDLYASVRYKLEQVEIGDIDKKGTRATYRPEVYQEDTTLTSSLTFGLTHDTRDYVMNPSRGHRYSGSVELAGLGGDTEFWKVIGEASWYQLLAKKLILAFDLETGWAGPYGGTDLLPLQERFFMGGANSVRGFEEGGLGPREPFIVLRRLNSGIWYDDQDDVAIGGELEFQTRTELRYEITEQIQGVVFLDSGAVWNEASDLDFGDLRLSTGVGLRVNLPIGAAIRLDLGYPLIEEDSDDTRVFHFGFNQSF
jgi:outer membrane protein insertion porin family